MHTRSGNVAIMRRFTTRRDLKNKYENTILRTQFNLMVKMSLEYIMIPVLMYASSFSLYCSLSVKLLQRSDDIRVWVSTGFVRINKSVNPNLLFNFMFDLHFHLWKTVWTSAVLKFTYFIFGFISVLFALQTPDVNNVLIQHMNEAKNPKTDPLNNQGCVFEGWKHHFILAVYIWFIWFIFYFKIKIRYINRYYF